MALDSIGSVAQSETSVLNQAGLGQDDFMKILLTQLTYQDPLSPMDNQEFIAQFAQFSQLEQSRQANDGIESLFELQASNQAVNLIGKTVEVLTEDGAVIGTVTTTSFLRGSPELTVRTLDGHALTNITLSQVVVVR